MKKTFAFYRYIIYFISQVDINSMRKNENMTSLNKKPSWYFLLFVFMVLLAISIISWDYVYRHTGVNPFEYNKCPLCISFNSIALGLTYLIVLFLTQVILIRSLLLLQSGFKSLSIYLSDLPHRAPPATV